MSTTILLSEYTLVSIHINTANHIDFSSLNLTKFLACSPLLYMYSCTCEVYVFANNSGVVSMETIPLIENYVSLLPKALLVPADEWYFALIVSITLTCR